MTTVTPRDGDDTPVPSPAELRAELEAMVVADLLGPVGGPEEEILTSIDNVVRDRYLLGVLAPAGTVAIDPERADSAEVEGNTSPDIPTDDEPMPDAAAAKAAMFPSSIGMSFVLEERATTLRVEGNWGHYEKEVTSEDGAAATEEGASLQASPGSASARSGGRRIWKRYPMGGVAPSSCPKAPSGPPLHTRSAPGRATRPDSEAPWLLVVLLVPRQRAKEDGQQQRRALAVPATAGCHFTNTRTPQWCTVLRRTDRRLGQGWSR